MPSEKDSSSSSPLSSSPLLASAEFGENAEEAAALWSARSVPWFDQFVSSSGEAATPASSPRARDPAPSSPMENASHWTLRTACALVEVHVDAEEEEGRAPRLGYLALMNL